MRMGRVVVLAWIAWASLGCERRPAATGSAPDSTAAPDRTPADAAVGAPPQPAGPQIGKTDESINAAAPRLAEWVGMWRRSLPGFEVDSLYRWGSKTAWEPGVVQPLESVFPPSSEQAATFQVLHATSPDGRYDLIFDRYQYIEEGAGGVEVGGEPDSAPLLLDRKLGTSYQFAFCGTPCGYHWGAWLSPTRFALAGWQEAGDDGRWKQGHLTLYSIADSSRVAYQTRIIPARDFAGYAQAWRSWVAARFRALTRSSPKA